MKNYASFFERLIAVIIDSIILAVVDRFSPGNYMFSIIVSTAYFVWMVGTYGASVGKMIMGIKIVTEEGGKVSYSDALLREIASILSLVVLLLGYLNVLWDDKRQSWHDKIAKTIVVKK